VSQKNLYKKKWIRDYERENQSSTEVLNIQDPIIVGLLIRTKIRKIIENPVRAMHQTLYSKTTYPIIGPYS
jgi:hypothetical protein